MPSKSTVPIVITDDSVLNSYGFRVLTDGGDLSMYKQNPIMLYDHARRSDENNKNIILPIGRMTNILRKGSQYIATPEFDTEDEFSWEVSRKYDLGIFNMASIGFEIIEVSDDPSVKLTGQMMPTVTKWTLKEVSITPVGANPNCCKVLHNGSTFQLNSKTKDEDVQEMFRSIKGLNADEEYFKNLVNSGEIERLRHSVASEDRLRLNEIWMAKFNKPFTVEKSTPLPKIELTKLEAARLRLEFNDLVRNGGINELRESTHASDHDKLNRLWMAKYDKPYQPI